MDAPPEMRYAHSEGLLDVCFDEKGLHMLTCGPDGDVRVYKGFDDDDPVSHRVGDSACAVVCMNSRIYVAADDNSIQCLTLSDGEPDGITARFTAQATHIVMDASGKTMAACSSDFTIKMIEIDSSKTKVLTGHTAPVLSVALHPKLSHVASSSCDGTVRVWAVSDGTLIKSFSCLPQTNDFFSSQILCRLAWNNNGSLLFVPVEKEVIAYDSESWSVSYKLTNENIIKDLTVLKLSPCGKYLAAAALNGTICIWQLANKSCIFSSRHPRGHSVTGLAWNPSPVFNGELVFADNYGYVGQLKHFLSSAGLTTDKKPAKSADTVKASDLFDDVDDDDIVLAAQEDDDDAMSAGDGRVPGLDTDVEEDEDDAGSVAQSSIVNGAHDEELSEAGAKKQITVVKGGWEPVQLQRPFQSGSAPKNLSTRFMMWNRVGVVIQYSTEEEQSINVEFHDTATHHSLHVNNSALDHSIADLSTEALILACESGADHSSQLVCMHFSSWDGCKEWSVAMPDGEDIQVVCLGSGWLAVGTDRRFVRIFSISGIQKEMISLPGPIVALAADQNKLMIVYHEALGVPGDQCLSIKMIDVVTRRCLLAEHLPLSAKSTLTWIGFSDEGSAFTFDSFGILRRYSRKFFDSWVPVANLRQLCKGKTDSYFIISLNEKSEQIRAVLCKGSKYPTVLPRPPIQLLPFQLPLCEASTDKSNFEDKYLRSQLMEGLFESLETEGIEFNATDKQRVVMNLQESLMKLFALSCKSRREFRAVEVAQLMPSSRTVQLAIRYASQTGNVQVAQRLNDVVREKLEQEQEQTMQKSLSYTDTADDDWRNRPVNQTSSTNRKRKLEKEVEPDVGSDDDDESVNRNEENNKKKTVTMLVRKDSAGVGTKPISISQSAVKKNPFKVTGVTVSSDKSVSSSGSSVKGSSVFDSMDKPKLGRAATTSLNDNHDSLKKMQGNSGNLTKLFSTGSTVNKKKSSAQSSVTGKENLSSNSSDSKSNQAERKSGFQMWFEENREAVMSDMSADDATASESELMIIAAKQFRQLEKSEQQRWQQKASGAEDQEQNKKSLDEATPIEDDDESADKSSDDVTKHKTGSRLEEEDAKNKKSTTQSTKNKLASFSFASKS